MLSPDQVPSQIKQVMHRSMRSHESLRLSGRLELAHPPLSHPGRFMGLLSPIILILLRAKKVSPYPLCLRFNRRE